MRLVSESALAGLKCGDDATKYCSSKAEELPEYFEVRHESSILLRRA